MSGQLPVRIVTSAARAITEAVEWWESNRPKALVLLPKSWSERFSLWPRNLPSAPALKMSNFPEFDASD